MKPILSYLIIAIPGILFAQNPQSTYDKDGNVKSVEQRKLEESQNKQHTVTTNGSMGSGTSASNRKEVRKVTKDLKNVKSEGRKKLEGYDYVGPSIPQDKSKMNVMYKIVSKDNKWGMVSIMGGNLVTVDIALFYDEIKYSDNLNLGVRVGDKWGFIDGGAYGMVLIPIIYDDLLSECSPVGTAVVVKDGKKYRTDREGEPIGGVKTDILTGAVENHNISKFEKLIDLTDGRDNKTYNTIRVNRQIIMAQNLSALFFRNGDPVPLVNSDEEWKKASEQHLPASCYYAYDPENGKKYGLLYNWYAVVDARGLAPEGWHIPTNDEWDILRKNIGGSELVGDKMKTTAGWDTGNGNDESGFAGLPGGQIDITDERSFFNMGRCGTWWTSSAVDANEALYRMLASFTGTFTSHGEPKQVGNAVRCFKN